MTEEKKDVIRPSDLKKQITDDPAKGVDPALGDVTLDGFLEVGTAIPGIDQTSPENQANPSDLRGHDVGAFGTGPTVSGSDECR